MKRLKFWLSGLILLSILFGGVSSATAADVELPHPYHGPYIPVALEDNKKYSPAVAYSTLHDEYMVVWEAWQSNDHHEIYGRRVTPSGQMSNEFLVYSGFYNSYRPAIAYDSNLDRYLVVWAYDSAGDLTDGDIYGRFIPWDGPVAGEEMFGVDVSRINQDKPRLAFSPISNEYLVVWREIADYENPWGVSGGIIYNDKTGFPVAISNSAEPRDYPDVAYNLMRNEFVVTWDMEVMGDLDIYAMRLAFNGQPQDPGEFAVANSVLDEQHPSVAACYSDDRYLFVWQQEVAERPGDDDLHGRMMSGSGTLGQRRQVESTTSPQM